MTATTRERMTKSAGLIPARGSYPIAANTLIRKGWQVGVNASGEAVPGDTIANGCVKAVGKASHTVDNRTGSELGGLAGATDVEVEYGVHGYLSKAGGGDDIAADDVGKVCFVVDNQTVALTNNTDTRGISGFISEVRNGQVYVWQGPHVVGEIIIAAAEAAELDVAQTDIDNLQTDVANLQTDAGIGFIPAPVQTWLEVDANGDVSNIAANGGVLASDTTPILRGNAAETFEIFWATGNVDPLSRSFILPPDFDGNQDVTVDLWVYSGATDAATFTVESGWDGGALVADSASDAATKSAVLHKITATIDKADIPNTARLLTVALTPTNAHATNGYGLLGAAINFKRVQT